MREILEGRIRELVSEWKSRAQAGRGKNDIKVWEGRIFRGR